MITDLGDINSRLASSFEKDSSLGLASGKMGGCIYFYVMGRQQNNPEYDHIAEELLGQVFAGIASVRPLDIKNGLCGIRLGISWLIDRKYVPGHPHEVLNDVDDTIFRHLCYPKYNRELDSLTLIQSLFYLYTRLAEPAKNREEAYLLNELTIQAINCTFERIATPLLFEEPLSYTVEYQLPLFLFAIGKIGRLGFYNHRITKILEELSPKILATIPVLHSNRLYLWAAMQPLSESFALQGWTQHIALLRRETRTDVLFRNELKNRNIYFATGVGSTAYLLDSLNGHLTLQDKLIYRDQIVRHIESSDVWDIYRQPGYIGQYKGLYDGIAGAILTWMAAKNETV